jgi:hypothetical protein
MLENQKGKRNSRKSANIKIGKKMENQAKEG